MLASEIILEDSHGGNVKIDFHGSDMKINRPKKIRIWVAGGVRLYEEALARRDYTRICITHIHGDFDCDRRLAFTG